MTATVIGFHSFRHGAGRSLISANFAAAAARSGARVALVDIDLESPHLHRALELDDQSIVHEMNDFLRGRCLMSECMYDVSPRLGPDCAGALFLAPALAEADQIAIVLRERFDLDRIGGGLDEIIADLQLDLVVLDTAAGLNESTMTGMALSDISTIVMQPDSREYQGTSVMVEVTRRLGVDKLYVVVNRLSVDYAAEAASQVRESYGCEVAAVLPTVPELDENSPPRLVDVHAAEHPFTNAIRALVEALVPQIP